MGSRDLRGSHHGHGLRGHARLCGQREQLRSRGGDPAVRQRRAPADRLQQRHDLVGTADRGQQRAAHDGPRHADLREHDGQQLRGHGGVPATRPAPGNRHDLQRHDGGFEPRDLAHGDQQQRLRPPTVRGADRWAPAGRLPGDAGRHGLLPARRLTLAADLSSAVRR